MNLIDKSGISIYGDYSKPLMENLKMAKMQGVKLENLVLNNESLRGADLAFLNFKKKNPPIKDVVLRIIYSTFKIWENG